MADGGWGYTTTGTALGGPGRNGGNTAVLGLGHGGDGGFGGGAVVVIDGDR